MGAIVEGQGHIRTPREEDRVFETAVLQQVLAIHPNPLTLGRAGR